MHENDEDLARGVTMGTAHDSPTAGESEGDPGVLVSLTFRRSASFGAFAAALAAAQSEMEGASKDSLNPHFKNRYADLASVIEASKPLSKHGIAIIQPPCARGPSVTVTTLLVHKSGEFIESDLTMTAQQNTPQGIGSCITYARRYALQAMVGIAPEDDDGNAASQPNGNRSESPRVELPPERPRPVPVGYDNWLLDMEAVAADGSEALQNAWNTSKLELRKHLTATNAAKWEALKKKAAAVQQAVSA